MDLFPPRVVVKIDAVATEGWIEEVELAVVYISRRELQAMLKEDKTKGQGGRRASFGPGSASSVTSLISEDRWNEMDWNRNGEIDFSDFVIGFSKWVVCDDEIEVGSPPSSQR